MNVKSSSKEIIVLSLLLLVLELVLFLSFWQPPVTLFPGKAFSLEHFSDTSELHGVSTVSSRESADSIAVTYTLKEGYEWPFAGIRIRPDSPLALDEFDYIQFGISGKDAHHLILSYWTTPVDITDDSLAEQPHFYGIILSDKKASYKVPVTSFTVPQWWLAYYDAELSNLPSDKVKKITGIDIRSGYEEISGTENSFTVSQIKLIKKNAQLYLIMVLLIVALYVTLFIKQTIERRLREKLVVPLKELQIPTESDNPLEKVIAAIGESCDNPELNLFKVAEACNITELEVSKAIKDAYGLNFKQYLNRVRMEIATTLLRESSLSIKEVTFKSGYKTNSHFFRVFRTFYNESPTEYRNRVGNNSK